MGAVDSRVDLRRRRLLGSCDTLRVFIEMAFRLRNPWIHFPFPEILAMKVSFRDAGWHLGASCKLGGFNAPGLRGFRFRQSRRGLQSSFVPQCSFRMVGRPVCVPNELWPRTIKTLGLGESKRKQGNAARSRRGDVARSSCWMCHLI